MSETTILPNWAYVQEPGARGSIKSSPEDFRVEEVLGFKTTGSGEHEYLFIEKRNMNTQDLVKLLARQLRIHPKHISYAGLKDKNAMTRQWFSIYTKKDIDITELESTKIRILESSRHSRKLKRGAHQANRFDIVVRDLSDTVGIEQRIERVLRHGVPNYYGEQRFGRRGKNIEKARALFTGINTASRYQRGLYLSAARSFLFNEVLSERVRQKNWATGLTGEVMMLDGRNSFFKTGELDEQLRERLAESDIHPSAPLWGKGALSSSDAAYALESNVIEKYPDITQGLESFGLRQQRRATRLIPQSLSYDYPDENSLRLKFLLPVGTFATTILRELITIRESVKVAN